MPRYEKIGALILLSLLVFGMRARAAELPFTREQWQEIAELDNKKMARRAAAQTANDTSLINAVPIVIPVKDSLSMDGTGLGAFSSHFQSQELLCQNGTLHYAVVTDYGQHYLLFSFDPTHNFATAVKEQLDELSQYLAMKSMTPALQQRLQPQVDAYKQARTPADLPVIQLLQLYSQQLTGANAVTQAQAGKLAASYAHRQQQIEDLQKLAAAHEKAPKDAALAAKLLKAYEQVVAFQQASPVDDNFFTPAQLKAMGVEAEPAANGNADSNSKPHHRASFGVSAGASSGGGNAGDVAAQMAKYEAEARERDKRVRDAAKLKFTLKGTDAAARTFSLDCPGGKVWMIVEVLLDGSGGNYLFYLDETDTWAKQREDWKKSIDLSKPDQAATVERLNQSTSRNAYMWGSPVDLLKQKTQAIPDDVQQRLNKMIKSWDDAAAVLVQTYQQALAKPADAALQRQLFEAFRNASRIERGNGALANRDFYDEAGIHNEIPWLLTVEQSDIANAGQVCTSSEVSSGFGGSLSISARPAGDKEYVAINASSATVGSLAEKVELSARKYFHNHKLKLTVDATASDKPLKGLVEGKSAEELFKSFAQRAGVNMVKDEKNPDAYVLKL